MKQKMSKLFSLLAVFLCLTVFSTAAYAQSDADAGEEVINGIVYSDTATAEGEESTEPQSLTPEGNMSLVDDIDSDDTDNMQFITVVSRNGNYFYLIIDRSGDGENTVHFLNQVDEADLLALIDEDATQGTEETTTTCICTTKCAAGSVNTYCAVCKLDMTQCCGEEIVSETDPETEGEPEAETGSGGNGTLVIVLILALAGGGAPYYFKIYKTKSKGNTDLDDYDFGDDDEPEDDADTEDYDDGEADSKTEDEAGGEDSDG